jgi:hypothetical protein
MAIPITVSAIVALLIGSVALNDAWAQKKEERLKELRARYQTSDHSIYLSESNLNNLTVHLRDGANSGNVLKLGVSNSALKTFRGFLEQSTFERAFFKIDLNGIRASYMLRTDLVPGIRHLSWTEGTVVEVAVICDAYLQKQLQLQALTAALSKGAVSLRSGWISLDQFKVDPMVPASTLTGALDAFSKQAKAKPADLAVIKANDPERYRQINLFVDMTRESPSSLVHTMKYDVPSSMKLKWANQHILLDGYWKATEQNANPWRMQLEQLQKIEAEKLLDKPN